MDQSKSSSNTLETLLILVLSTIASLAFSVDSERNLFDGSIGNCVPISQSYQINTDNKLFVDPCNIVDRGVVADFSDSILVKSTSENTVSKLKLELQASKKLDTQLLEYIKASSANAKTLFGVLILADVKFPDAPSLALRNDRVKLSLDKILNIVQSQDDFKLKRQYRSFNALAADVTLNGLVELLADPSVVRIGLDVQTQSMLIEALPLVKIDFVNGHGITGEGVEVAVLDSGIDSDNTDFQSIILTQRCFLDWCSNGLYRAEDLDGHGSHVTGIIASQGNVAPRGGSPNVGIHSLQVLDGGNEGFGYTSWSLNALDYILNELPNVRVINMSLGSFERGNSSACDDADTANLLYSMAIKALKNRGALTVVSSGNDGSLNSISSPACISSAMAVGAVLDTESPAPFYQGELADYSNSNELVDIVAPGSSITSVAHGGGSVTYYGTSMAAPVVTSCAALLFEYAPELTVDEVKEALKTSKTLIQDGAGRYFPRLDCQEALVSLGQDLDSDGVVASYELVTNGDFSSGIGPWAGEAAVTGNIAYYFAVTETTSSNVYDVNLNHTITLVPDETYNITFKAKSSINRTMIAGLGLNHDPWTNVAESVALTTEWQTFTLAQASTVDGVGFGDDDSRLLFDMGGEQGGQILIDDVSLTDVDGNELISNGSFSAGVQGWAGGAAIDTNIVSYFAVTDTTSNNVYDINLSQLMTLVPDGIYTINFAAKSSIERTMVAGLGLNHDPWTNVAEPVALTNEWQTFTLAQTSTVDGVGFGDDDSRLLFDMGGEQGGHIWIDDVSVISNGDSDNCISITNGDQLDTDRDLFGDACDLDDDNDDALDDDDAFPLDATESFDTDSDGTGNNADTDDDNDGVLDADDAFPIDASETADSDSDGIGDNADSFPFDSSETIDSDEDGIGNNSDTDDDNDGVDDSLDAFPLNENETLDSDWDGIGNNTDTDDDNDGAMDSNDSWPTDYLYAADSNQNNLPDEWEARYSKAVDPDNSQFDWDNDGLNLINEFLNKTSPILADSDQDTIPDGAEVNLNLDPIIPDYSVAVGNLHTCAKDDSGVHCWGQNPYGQLDVPQLKNPKLIGAGDHHSCALDDDGVQCWGTNWNGESSVPSLDNPYALAFSNQGTCALDNTGAVCWGWNGSGQMNTPTLRNPISIDGGPWQFCAVDDTGLVCWGFNGNSEISITSGLYPDLYDTGKLSTCASFDNQIQCWGLLQSFGTAFEHDFNQVKDLAPVVLTEDLGICILGESFAKCTDIGGRTLNNKFLGSKPAAIRVKDDRYCGLDLNGVICVPGGRLQLLQMDPDKDGVMFKDGDLFPFDPLETIDTDLDGIGNNTDVDDDGDSVSDELDAFPLDAEETVDTDSDGVGDNADAFPLDISETLDTDLDGIGNNGDLDDDGDGVADSSDSFPLDADETLDTDSDGIGNNADMDDDGDGVQDSVDVYPLNSLYTNDSDNDGMPDAWETKYGLDPNDASDATSDQDNDSVSALDEFLAGTIPSGSLDIDGNAQYDALTDGLLLLRGMFGLDGSALVTGTIASDAAYTEPADIESRIAILGDLADIDGNGEIDALTDGLLTLRYLFGLEGDTLIIGVVASDATRTSAEQIEVHLKTLMPAL